MGNRNAAAQRGDPRECGAVRVTERGRTREPSPTARGPVR